MVPGPNPSEGESDFRRAFEARPCSYVDLGSSQAFGCESSRVSEREERHPDCVGISWEEEEIYRGTFLGPGGILFPRLGYMSRRSGSI
jgi:hypothetical protein